MPRTTRAGTARAAETRAAEQRVMPALDDVGPLHVPAHLVPKGMVYRWVRESLVGMPDGNNMSARARRGWRPVPANRPGHDILMQTSMFGADPANAATVIRNGGLLLCEMPKREHDRLMDAMRARNMSEMQASPGLDHNALNETAVVNVNQVSRTLEREFKE